MTSSQVLELVERFERNLSAYKSAEYKEARVRVEFIDPFFIKVGWVSCHKTSRLDLTVRT